MSGPAEGENVDASTGLAALTRLCREFANAESSETIFAAAAAALVAAAGVTRVAVLALDEAGSMRFRAWRGLSDAYRQRVEGHSPWSVDDASPQTILVDDVTTDPAMAPFQDAFAREGIGALAFLPLLPRGELLGKFMLYADVPTRWVEKNLAYAHAVADLLGCVLARERMQTRLQRAHEIERLGILAGDIAHGFANVLTSINGYGDLARQETPPASRAHEFIDGLLRTVQTGSGLTRSLLALAQPRADAFEPIDLAELVAQSLDDLRRLAGRGIELRLARDLAPARIRGSRSSLQRVLVDLVVHARDAMPQGGTVTVRLRRAATARGSGPSVELEVSDDGAGMDAAAQQRMFQPQLATRGGAGSGLAVCYSIVVRHGGDISVRSVPGHGSTVCVRLPLLPTARPAPAGS